MLAGAFDVDDVTVEGKLGGLFSLVVSAPLSKASSLIASAAGSCSDAWSFDVGVPSWWVRSSLTCEAAVLDGLVGVWTMASVSISFLEGVGTAADADGVPGRSGSAGVMWELVRFRLALLAGRDEPSRSGSPVGFVKPGGTVGVERRLSLATWDSKPGGTGGVDFRDSAREMLCCRDGASGGKSASSVKSN